MTPQQFPNVRQDKSCQEDARVWCEHVMERINKSDFGLINNTLRTFITDTYMQALQSGFNMGWRIRENRMKNESPTTGYPTIEAI